MYFANISTRRAANNIIYLNSGSYEHALSISFFGKFPFVEISFFGKISHEIMKYWSSILAKKE